MNNVNAYNENNITYTASGNILTLQRNMNGTSTPTAIDNLSCTYDTANPGQLKTVTDGTGSNYTNYGFRNLTGSTGSYTYDANGNLTADPYKGLTLAYNPLNKTDKITVTTATGRYINYTYDGSGQLIRKQAYDNNTLQTTTDYIDGYVYENSTLSYFPMPEGRIRNTGSGLKAEYIITDQQGNARVSLEENPSSPGTALVRQENSFYGFGLVMPGSPVATPTDPNKQLYNGGSEWQNDFTNDLPNYYQTFYRNYDAATGRWAGVDPMAEAADELNTYQYAGNNPISFNDPMGDFVPPYYNFGMHMLRQRIDPGPPGALPDYIPDGLHDSHTDYQGIAADQAFNEFVNSSGTAGYGNDLLRAAQSGDPNAVAAYARKYGETSTDPNVIRGTLTWHAGSEQISNDMWIDPNTGAYHSFGQYNDYYTVNVSGMNLSQQGLDFIARHEWFGSYPDHNNPYNDSNGYATVGYGHLLHYSAYTQADYSKYHNMTADQGMILLKQDIISRVNDVNRLVKTTLTQQQFDALVDFDFRNGVGNFSHSTLLKDINSGIATPSVIINDIMQWTLHGQAGGINRAKDEIQLYLNNIYTRP